jgi:hypothetical protein
MVLGTSGLLSGRVNVKIGFFGESIKPTVYSMVLSFFESSFFFWGEVSLSAVASVTQSSDYNQPKLPKGKLNNIN